MRRRRDTRTAPTDDLRIRALTEADAEAIGAIWASARAIAYAGIVPDEIAHRSGDVLSGQVGSLVTDPRLVALVAVDGEEIVGFVVAGPPEHDGVAGDAEISLIYVAPKAQGRGVGRLLMCHALQRLHAADMRSLFLWTLRDNRIGVAFYEGLGASVLREAWSESNKNFLVAYGWDDIGALMEKTCRRRGP